MDCVFSPACLVPPMNKLSDRMYSVEFINHLDKHLEFINKFDLKLKASNNFYLTFDFLNEPEFNHSKQDLIELLYGKNFLTILESCLVCESDTCCTIDNPVSQNVDETLMTNWCKLVDSVVSENLIIILDFESKKSFFKINDFTVNSVVIIDDWYEWLNEISYFEKNEFELSLEIYSKKNDVTLDKEYCFKKSFTKSVSKLDEKTTRNVITTLSTALNGLTHNAEKLHRRGKICIYRMDCDSSHRIHYESKDGVVEFMHYGDHELGL